MTLEPISVPGWPRPRGYSDGMVAPGASKILFVSGQIGWNERQQLVSSDFVAQFQRALENVLTIVRAAGGGPASLARLTIFVTDKKSYLARQQDVGAAYRAVLGKHYPAMSLVQVNDLLEAGALVEIEATAAL